MTVLGRTRFPCFLFGLVLLAAGCASPNDTHDELVSDPPPVAAGLNMRLEQRGDSAALVSGLARALAVALDREETRHLVWQYLSHSEVREKKVHLQRFLRRAGIGLEAILAREAGLNAGRWVELADRLADLELYMPVASQRATWDGSAGVLVASVFENDAAYEARGGTLVAYDGRGRAVTLSTSVPPDVPVLVLTKAESQFDVTGTKPPIVSNAQCTLETCGSGGDGGTAPPPAVRLIAADLQDHGEGWARGDPELVIAVQVLVNNRYQILTSACAHEEMHDDRLYDQDSSPWSGNVNVITVSSLQDQINLGRRPVIIMWEDDNGDKCAYTPENAQTEAANGAAASALSGTVAVVALSGPPMLGLSLVVFAAGAFLYAESADDFIGLASIPAHLNPFQNPRQLTRVGSNGTISLVIE